MKFTKTLTSIAIFSVLVTGCSIPQDTLKKTNKNTDIAKKLSDRVHDALERENDLIVFEDTAYIASKPVYIEHAKTYPEWFDLTDKAYTVRNIDFEELLSRVSDLTGIRITVGQTANSFMNPEDEEGMPPATTNVSGVSLVKGDMGSPGSMGMMGDGEFTAKESFSYSGTIAGMLDAIADQYHLSWRYIERSKSVEFYRLTTKIYTVDVSNEITNYQSIINARAQDQVGAQNNAQLSVNSQMVDPWLHTVEAVKKMLTDDGSIEPNAINKTITVTTTPENQHKISEYIDKANRLASVKFTTQVNIVSVRVNADSDYGLELNTLLKSIGMTVNTVNLASPLTVSNNVGQVLFNKETGAWNIDAAINAMQSLGKDFTQYKFSVNGPNGYIKPASESQQTSYISSVTANVQTGVTGNIIVYTPQTDIMNTGYWFYITPTLTSNGKVNLGINGTVKVGKLTTQSVGQGDGEVTLQLPNIKATLFNGNNIVNSGEVTVMVGMDQVTNKYGQSSLVDPSWWEFGGNQTTAKERVISLMFATTYRVQ